MPPKKKKAEEKKNCSYLPTVIQQKENGRDSMRNLQCLRTTKENLQISSKLSLLFFPHKSKIENFNPQ